MKDNVTWTSPAQSTVPDAWYTVDLDNAAWDWQWDNETTWKITVSDTATKRFHSRESASDPHILFDACVCPKYCDADGGCCSGLCIWGECKL